MINLIIRILIFAEMDRVRHRVLVKIEVVTADLDINIVGQERPPLGFTSLINHCAIVQTRNSTARYRISLPGRSHALDLSDTHPDHTI